MLSTIVYDSDRWVKQAFSVGITDTFKAHNEVLNYVLQDEQFSDDGVTPTLPPEVEMLLQESGEESGLPSMYVRPKSKDTSVGGNDAFNSYYQFNETDDVIHPATSIYKLPDKKGMEGMGRVYSETFDETQQIVYFAMGVPVFNSVSSFWMDAIQGDVVKLMHSGGDIDMNTLGRLIGSTVGTIMKLPIMPLLWLSNVLDGFKRHKVSKYYDFKSAMPHYFRFWNSMNIHLAANMGLGGFGAGVNDNPASKVATTSAEDLYAANADFTGDDLPELFRLHSMDIYKILLKRHRYLNGKALEPDESRSDDFLYKIKDFISDGFSNFVTSIPGSILDANMFVGYRTTSNITLSESFSNTTSQSAIASAVNSHKDSAQSLKFSLGGGNIGDGAIANTIEGFLGGVSGIFSGMTNAAGIDGIENLIKGSATIDIPEQFTGSSFSRSYNLEFESWTPYGDPVSVMQMYMPVLGLMAMALPRAAGKNSYTSPFFLRVYCKGAFSMPLAMITGMEIARGDDTHGFTNQKLPTSVKVTLTLKDLSPAMYMAMADDPLSPFGAIFGENSTFQEYLLTLSGMGLQDRMLRLRSYMRKAEIFKTLLFNQRLNPATWGYELGQTSIGRGISAIMPITEIPNN